MFDRLNDRATELMTCAHRRAIDAGDEAIDATHLLLGFLEVDTWCCKSLLGDAAFEQMCAEIESLVERRHAIRPQTLPFTKLGKRALESTLAAAMEFETDCITPE